MELKLQNGDYIPDGLGGVIRCGGADALLERVLFRLTAHRGQFPLLPELGSRLYLLCREKPAARAALAAGYAAEALADQPVQVTRAEWEEETGRLTVYLAWQGESLSATVYI